MDKNLHQIAKAPMIALIHNQALKGRPKHGCNPCAQTQGMHSCNPCTKPQANHGCNPCATKTLLLLLLLGLIAPMTALAQDVGNPSRALNECRKPTQLTVSQITANSAQLSWTENGDADTWIVAYRTDDDDDFNEVITAENPYNLTGLTPETYYIVKVSPYCEWERWSDEIAFITLEACPAPTGLQVDNLTTTIATLSWTGFSESYNVRYRTSMVRGERGATASEWQTYYTSEPTLTLTGLVPETDYEAQVQGDCGNDGYSEWSEIITFTTESDWFAGSGTEDDPYLIATTDDMDRLAALVNNGHDQSGVYFLQTDTLDYRNKTYTPVGNGTNSFQGNYNGNGNIVTGVNINTEYAGLFGRIGANGVVSNLTLDGIVTWCYIVGDFAGGIAAVNQGEIVGCSVLSSFIGLETDNRFWLFYEYVYIFGSRICGGLVGDNRGNVYDAECTALIECGSNSNSITGGLVGTNNGQVNGAFGGVLYGILYYHEGLVGGLVGRQYTGTLSGINRGYFNGNDSNFNFIPNNNQFYTDWVGGIVGHQMGGTVENCLYVGNRWNKFAENSHAGAIISTYEYGVLNNNYYVGECEINGMYNFINGSVDVIGQAMRGYKIEPQDPLVINLEGSIGLAYEGSVYAGNEQSVVVGLNTPITPQCYILSAGTIVDNGDDTYSLTMPAEDITIAGNIVEFYGTYYAISCEGDTTATAIYDASYATKHDISIEDFEYLGKQYTVTAIADGAFDGCDSIENFDCHSNIISIGDHAFRNCTGILYFGFYHTDTPPALGEGVFEGLGLDTLMLMVPYCSQYDYSIHPVFGQFGEIFPDGNCEYNFINQSGDKLWSNPANWAEGEVPGETARVAIFDDCEIDTDVTVGSVTIGYYYDEYYGLYERLTVKDGATLTATNYIYNTGDERNFIIEDGAQVVHPNAGAKATVQKAVSAYSTQSGVNNGWHLIALPLTGSIDVDSVGNMIGGEYDLYAYDESTAYWKNSKNTENSFTALEATKGYLYAHGEDVTLEFSGTLQNSSATISVPLSYTTVAHLSGFNLVGNPFPCEAYLDRAYYVLSANGTDINPEAIPSTVPIPPCTAVFVKAVDEGDSAVFTRVAP